MSDVVGVVGEGLGEVSLGSDLDSSGLGAGGDAANICVMAARAGARVRLLGRIGADGLGDRLRAFWSERGVELSSLRRDPLASTGIYLNEGNPDGSHRFSYWRSGSAGSRLCEADLRDDFLDGLGMVVITGVSLAVSASSARTCVKAAAEARRLEIPLAVVINHRPVLGGDLGILVELIGGAEIVIGSREDLGGVFGDPETGLRRLRAPGLTGREIMISDRAQAATLITDEGEWTQSPPSRRVHNAAGAGDALAGAYLAARVAGREPSEGLRSAVAAASISVGRDGCASSYPSVAEIAAEIPNLPERQRTPAANLSAR